MALSLMLLCLVAAAAAQKREWVVANSEEVERLGASYELLADTCDKICDKGESMTMYPGACNLYLHCVVGQNRIYVQQCSGGTIFLNSLKICAGRHFLTADDPCGGQNDPCTTMKKMPDKNGCMYHQCKDGVITALNCQPGTGFDAVVRECSQQASAACQQPRYKELDFSCQPIGKSNDSYNKTVTRWVDVLGAEQRTAFTVTMQCPAELYYPPEINNCTCIRKPEKGVVCKDYQLVDLSSARDTWSASHAGAPGLYKLEGNLTLDNNGQAYVTQSDLHVPALLKNDLGSRWNLSVTFNVGYKRPDGNFQPGFVESAGGQDIAVVGNSICDTPPTFGCRLRRTSTNGFTVVCFANEHQVTSTQLNVGNPVTVTLSRVDSVGRMVVSSQGQRVDEKSFQFAEGEQVKINDCPLTIGHSADGQDFSGYMDNIFLFKYACN